MGNQHQRDAIRAYMAEHGVNYTTAKRALREAVYFDPLNDFGSFVEHAGGEVVDMNPAPGDLVLGGIGGGKGWVEGLSLLRAAQGEETKLFIAPPRRGKTDQHRWVDEAWNFTGTGATGSLVDLRDGARERGWTMGPAATVVSVWLTATGWTKVRPGDLAEHADALAEVVSTSLCPMGKGGTLDVKITEPGAGTGRGAARARVTFDMARDVVADALREARPRLPEDAGVDETLDVLLNTALAALDISPWEGTGAVEWRTRTPVRFADAVAGSALLPDLLHAPTPGTPAHQDWVGSFTHGRPIIGAGAAGPVRLDLTPGPVLIAGWTGSGKTVLLDLLAYGAQSAPGVSVALLTGRNDVYKAVDQAALAYSGNWTVRADDVLDALTGIVEEMRDRHALLIESGQPTPTALRALGHDAVPDRLLVLVDEPAMWHGRGPDEEAFRLLTQIAEQGSSAEVHLVVSTQRVEAGSLPGGLRSMFTTRIGMGRRTPRESSLLFGADTPPTQEPTPRGRGDIATDSTPTPVQVMLLPRPEAS